ncbi:type 1 fimbrial protein [Cronobacter turicensis]|uniref:fimbrial protein n=2 Tax=Cronobacter TaxID=413496 RepID=UPI000CFD6054|nr:fimbrial protein [Cronobacter turicensis]MEB8540891.1 fimbrial protein [Cronobacter sakazakii]EGT4492633.1 type 1 fimbrial protein [Cronobacter turicensis]EKM0439844.1 type 1 fimbrial protein [Cronobacter turicensis]EKM0528872.1 type 1 fimbrial protein [Cronobacter turicensis]EKM0666786.1 type 1 fimbrial protein [Cronobacter turicensis]
MKKIISGLAVAAVCFSSATYATTTTQDVPATLNISGTVSANKTDQCQILLNQEMINLTASANNLIEQGQNGTSTEEMTFSVSSTSQVSECDKQLYDGKIAVKFVGTYDDADGTAFANTAVGENAATGVGIGLFNHDKTPLDASEIYNLSPGSNTATKIIGLQLIKLKGETVKTGAVAGNITFQVERL